MVPVLILCSDWWAEQTILRFYWLSSIVLHADWLATFTWVDAAPASLMDMSTGFLFALIGGRNKATSMLLTGGICSLRWLVGGTELLRCYWLSPIVLHADWLVGHSLPAWRRLTLIALDADWSSLPEWRRHQPHSWIWAWGQRSPIGCHKLFLTLIGHLYLSGGGASLTHGYEHGVRVLLVIPPLVGSDCRHVSLQK